MVATSTISFDITRMAHRFQGWSARSLKKGMVEPAAPATAEAVIEGVTHDSIAAFVAARDARVEAHRRADTR